jgi:L-fuculose-phosphate aldolase
MKIMEDLTHDLEELAIACRILHMEGHADLTLGHLAMRDPEGRGVWMKRSGIGLGEVQGAQDFVLLDFNGSKHTGTGNLHKEWPIHTEILRARPDISVVGHSHPFHATAFSALNRKLEAVSNEATYLGSVPGRFTTTSDLIDTPELGRGVAAALDSASTVFLRNHGICYVGTSIAECTLMGIFLERACRSHLAVLATGCDYTSTPEDEVQRKKSQILDAGLLANFWSFYKRKLQSLKTSNKSQSTYR